MEEGCGQTYRLQIKVNAMSTKGLQDGNTYDLESEQGPESAGMIRRVYQDHSLTTAISGVKVSGAQQFRMDRITYTLERARDSKSVVCTVHIRGAGLNNSHTTRPMIEVSMGHPGTEQLTHCGRGKISVSIVNSQESVSEFTDILHEMLGQLDFPWMNRGVYRYIRFLKLKQQPR